MLLFHYRYLKSDRVVILMNLCIALTVSYIIFLAGVNQTQNRVSFICNFVLKHNCYHFKGPSEVVFLSYRLIFSCVRSDMCRPSSYIIFAVRFLVNRYTLQTHFSAYMRRGAFIITSNKNTLSLFLKSKDSLS